MTSLRRWLRSDMRTLRWVFLSLYVLLILAFASFVLANAEPALLMFPAIMIVAQAIFIFGAGTINLCRPIRRRRLLIPILVAATMMTLLALGAAMALLELLKLDNQDDAAAIVLLVIGGSWIGWGVLLFVHVRHMPRFAAMSRLANIIFAGSLLELLASVPSHIIVSRRPGCLVGMMTMFGIIAGCSVMLFSFGPMIVLLFLRPRYRAELLDATTPTCQACGYDLRASKDRCPECGLPFVTVASA